MAEKRNRQAYMILVVKPLVKFTLGRWKDNIKMNMNERFEAESWIELAQDHVQ
jgi:hypothetical protein